MRFEYLVYIVLAVGLYRFFNPFMKGILGELKVRLKLLMLPSDKYKVLNDILLTTKRGTTQIDHIVVSIYGIFVIETKNYKGKIIGTANKLEWIKEIHGNKYYFRNPIIQNKGHIRALANRLKIDEKLMIPIVVFLGNCRLDIKTKSQVLYASKLLQTIKSRKKILLNKKQVEDITNIIKALNKKGAFAKLKHIMYVKKRERSNKRTNLR